MKEMSVYSPSSTLTEQLKFFKSNSKFPFTYVLLEFSFFCIGTGLQALSPSPLTLSLSFHLQ